MSVELFFFVKNKTQCFVLFPTSKQTTITAISGQDVTLPRRNPTNNIVLGAKWNRPDLEPEYVLLFRDGHFVLHDQQRFYEGRVDLRDRQMGDGDLSLIQEKVTSEDTGTYECRILTQRQQPESRDVITIRFLNSRVVPPGE